MLPSVRGFENPDHAAIMRRKRFKAVGERGIADGRQDTPDHSAVSDDGNITRVSGAASRTVGGVTRAVHLPDLFPAPVYASMKVHIAFATGDAYVHKISHPGVDLF